MPDGVIFLYCIRSKSKTQERIVDDLQTGRIDPALSAEEGESAGEGVQGQLQRSDFTERESTVFPSYSSIFTTMKSTMLCVSLQARNSLMFTTERSAMPIDLRPSPMAILLFGMTMRRP